MSDASSHGLTPAELERMALLTEQCGEVVQAVGRILRHGFAGCHPEGGPSNREALAREIGDLRVAIELVMRAPDVDEGVVDRAEIDKWIRLHRYTRHQRTMFDKRR